MLGNFFSYEWTPVIRKDANNIRCTLNCGMLMCTHYSYYKWPLNQYWGKNSGEPRTQNAYNKCFCSIYAYSCCRTFNKLLDSGFDISMCIHTEPLTFGNNVYMFTITTKPWAAQWATLHVYIIDISISFALPSVKFVQFVHLPLSLVRPFTVYMFAYFYTMFVYGFQ